MAATHDLIIDQGATWRRTVTYADANSVPKSLTGYTATLIVKDAAGGATLLTLNAGNGGTTLLDPGSIRLYLSAIDTAAITWTTGVYRLTLVSPMGDVVRLLQGVIIVGVN